MALVSEHFLKLPGSYLFSGIAKKVNTFRIACPKQDIIQLGIGGVARPPPNACIEAMHKAAEEMTSTETFRGYGPEQGYDFLVETIIRNDHTPRGIHLSSTEAFINDGARSDTGNIGDILRHNSSVGVTDPIYPVYIDSNVMCERTGVLDAESGKRSNVAYILYTAENHFIPAIPEKHIDIVYLCYPNNPAGTTLTKAELKKWVDYALANDTLILFDVAYEAYIREPDVPHSIYEIKGAKRCAIGFHSFSKATDFTRIRCGYTTVPKELTAATLEEERIPLNRMWNRRQCTKFNGTSYVTQRAVEAVYSPEGRGQIQETVNYYMTNTHIMKEGLESTGLKVYGRVSALYLWVKTPNGASSWRFFDRMLYEASIVGTPGAGFGPSVEGYIRLTAFGERNDCIEVMRHIKNWL